MPIPTLKWWLGYIYLQKLGRFGRNMHKNTSKLTIVLDVLGFEFGTSHRKIVSQYGDLILCSLFLHERAYSIHSNILEISRDSVLNNCSSWHRFCERFMIKYIIECCRISCISFRDENLYPAAILGLVVPEEKMSHQKSVDVTQMVQNFVSSVILQ